MPYKELSPQEIGWRRYYRIIPSRLPTINVLEKYVEPDKLQAAFEVESITNDRLRQMRGELKLVKPEDIVTGPNASVVMAAFTHIGNESRFSNGNYGVFYAANSIEAALKETIFHRERYLRFTESPPRILEMRCYSGNLTRSLLDVRTAKKLHNPDLNSYPESQKFAARQRSKNFNGLLYQSVRYPGSECIAAFKPKAISLPIQKNHYQYHWNGKNIDRVLKMEQIDIV